VLGIVPVKGLDGAKTRLAPLLPPDERARLVLEMLERVLDACRESAAIARTLLVTPDRKLAPKGTEVLVDAGPGHSAAVAGARAGAVVVMADCPLVTGASLDALAAAARPLALAPSRDGGVNALALRPVDGFRPAFGVRAEETVARARAAGIEPVVLDDERLALDVDRPEDYELLLART
jgi:2-phospho-L-lactate/phosphoenolpyruvate guanylyltransferase